MKIELKRIEFSERLSEETNAFTADIWCDGKKVGICKNDGRGGCTDYYGFEKYHSDDIKRMEDYCKTLPPIVYTQENEGFDMTLDMNLEHYIDNLFEDWLKEKENKKLLKKMEKGLLISKNPKFTYSIITWKNQTIEGMLRNTVLTASLKQTIKKYRGEGYTIMNTNIPDEILN